MARQLRWNPISLAWATYVNYASVAALALDASDNIVIGGQAYTGFTATSGALQTAYPGGTETQPGNTAYDSAAGFVAKINPSATQYIFATYLGGNNYQRSISSYAILSATNGVTAAALDAEGTIWVTGGSLPSELPLPISVPILGSNYVVGLSPKGSNVTAATTAPEGGVGLGIAISPQGPVALGKSGSTLIPAPAMPSLVGIANWAGLTASGSVSPNELISLYGEGLGPSAALSGVWSTVCAPPRWAASKCSLTESPRRCFMPGRTRSTPLCLPELSGRVRRQ
jgi:hypothetical protein